MQRKYQLSIPLLHFFVQGMQGYAFVLNNSMFILPIPVAIPVWCFEVFFNGTTTDANCGNKKNTRKIVSFSRIRNYKDGD